MTQTTNDEAEDRPRGIARSARGITMNEGAGLRVTRALGTPLMQPIDPFLLFDELRSDDPGQYLPGFPDHPHRGFETITYMIAGRFRHRDNHGHEGVLESGGAQWMTAGRGIVHREMPEQKEGLVWGFQLWLNLPASEKMCEPSYKDLQPWDIPVAKLPGGAEARVLAGRLGDIEGSIQGRSTTPMYVDVSIPAGVSTKLTVPEGLAGFVYPFEGAVRVRGSDVMRALRCGELGVLADDGDALCVEALHGPTRMLLVAGKPLREPVVQHGPFVMNTRAEIEQAFADFSSGKF